ncbi:cystathionine gamma-lyase [Streptomyces sp. DSM 44915]|uniref:Cystathionine gamma-lyase n=1 Tax=Streptomyces chisholmiae TaxID=3075540 RepID=A0ABU2JQ82_9ACTN|nr:cystathionine gamma-lyase [Streptomyces sp. DSM 44915]MDT0267067.1 cystathionine gamma-lyase [Streptomyces sp. DSM 44915]
MTGDGTRAVRAGLPAVEPYQPPMPPPVLAAHFHLPGDPAVAPFGYGRENNPTWVGLERAIAELESPAEPAEAVVFPSGMAAISAAVLALVKPGEAVVLPTDGYQLWPKLRERLESFGLLVHTAPTSGDAQLAALESAHRAAAPVRLLWLETPSNPGLDLCDIARLSAAAHARGALVAVDNSLATPLGQRPLQLGADLSVASGTKGLNGHGDVLLGYVASRQPALVDEVRRWRTTTGAIPGPMESWLVHRGLATLHLRVARQAENALAVARALADRPEVTGLRHPGLPTDRDHALAVRQMRAFGCVVSFTLPDLAHAERFLTALELVDDATSFGGVRSTAERRGRWGGDAVPAGFVRLSVGVEDPADLVADVRRALDVARG